MAANGTTALDPISWGKSTGGAAGSAETTSTLGVDRLDVRIPPDNTRIWGSALNNAKALLISISQTFKGGTRLGALSQSANPFAVGECGFWTDGTNPKFTNAAGTITTLGAGSGTGNWTFSGNNATLTGAATMGIGLTVATAISIGATGVTTTFNGPVTHAANQGITYTAGTGVADFSNGSGIFKTTTGASTFGGSSNDFTANITNTMTGIGIAQTSGLTLTNTTAATSGSANQKWSPGFQQTGQQWNGSASVAVDTMLQVRPNTGTTVGGDLVVYNRYNGGSWAEQISFRDSGWIWGTNNTGGPAASSKIRLNDNSGTSIWYGTSYMGIQTTVTGFSFNVSGTDRWYLIAGKLYPTTDNADSIGDLTHRAKGLFNSANLSGGYRSAASVVTAAVTDHFIGVSGSGARTVNLPAANTYPAGALLVVQDVGNSAGAISVTPNGTDTINGVNAAVTISVAYGRKWLVCDGASGWYVNATTI